METDWKNQISINIDMQDTSQGRILGHPLSGLSEEEAQRRRARGLGNDIKFKTSRSYFEILRENLFTFFNMVLFGLGIALVLMGKPIEALITSGVVFINVIVAVTQELRAKRKLDAIALLTRPKATVVRDGQERSIDPALIVQGDLLVLHPGEQVVVDGEVVTSAWMRIDESLLSGEGDRVVKKRGDSVYSGSLCVAGEGSYLAQRVGSESLATQLATKARTFKHEYTPLQREVNLIIRILLVVVSFFLVLHTIDALLQKTSILESVRAASVLFGLAPNSLFLMIVVAYAWGAVRIAGKGALVQQANSVESLCNVTVLCLDKTGTLTTNKIQLEDVLPVKQDQIPLSKNDLDHLLGAFGRGLASKTRTSEAIIAATPNGIYEPLEQVPFSSELGWSGAVFKLPQLQGTFVLGAPERLWGNLHHGDWHLVGSRNSLERTIQERTSAGQRVLLFTCRLEQVQLYSPEIQPNLPNELIPLCLLCFSDELRPEAMETLRGFAQAGIEIKIISGDSPETVISLARQAGLANLMGELHPISGMQLAEMDEVSMQQAVKEKNIFGRVSPQIKEKIVRGLRDCGHYVAMTGDGVNDVLALKVANLGIAMQSGSPATRSVAGILLLNDSFSVLPQAFSEGQRILNGMEDILRLYLTRILTFGLLVVAIGWVAGVSPFTPKQNSLLSLLTLSIPAFMLALWARPGPVPRVSLIQRLGHFVLPAALTSSGVSLLVYIYFLLTTGDTVYTQHMLTYFLLGIGLLLLIFVEPPTKFWAAGDELSGDWRPTIVAFGMFFVFLAFFLIPPIREVYELVPLRVPLDGIILSIAVIAWAILLRYTWRLRLLDRYFAVDLGGPSCL